MEPITVIYSPTPESRRFALLVGLFFMVVGGALVCLFTALGGMAVALTSRGPPGEAPPLGGAILCCGAPLALAIAALGVRTAFFSARGQQVVLDAERITHEEHALPLERIVRVAAHQGWQRRVPFWTVRVEDDAHGVIGLEVTQDRWVGTFDVRRILRDLLPRLPAACVVDPRVRAYAEGARM